VLPLPLVRCGALGEHVRHHEGSTTPKVYHCNHIILNFNNKVYWGGNMGGFTFQPARFE
jgi:hypothetical protein